jgi:hypothetical protein
MSGRTVAFEGLTDSRGRFATEPLAPGFYTIELRVPKNIITPAQYFVTLGGARPASDAMSAPGVALSMNAEVRNAGSMRGQVTARRVNIIPAQTTTTSTTTSTTSPTVRSSPPPAQRPGAPRMGTARPPTAAPAPAAAAPAEMSTFAPRPGTNQPRIINGRPHIWVPITAGANIGRWVPAPASRR